MPSTNLQSNVWKYYIYSFLSGIMFYGPIYILFFQRFGLSFTQIMLFLSVYGVTTLVSEVPTGILSDYIGRRKTLVMAGIASVLSFSVFAAGTEYLHFILAYVVMAIAESLRSGTQESFIYDTLLQMKRVKDYKKILGMGGFLGSIGVTLSFLVGGFLFVMGFRIPYIATAVAAGLLFLVTLTFIEPKRANPTGDHRKHLEKSLKLVATHPKLKWLTLYSVLIVTGFVLNYFTNQPYMKFLGLAPEHFGIIMAIGTIVAGLSGKYAYKIEEYLGEKLSLVLPPLFIAVGYLLISQFSFLYAFAFLWLISFGQGFFGPIISDYSNKHISSSNRATVLSIQGALTNMSFTIFSPMIGYLVDAYSLQTAFILEGIVIGVLGIGIVLSMKFIK